MNRREQRRTHLDASAVPVERALLARAEHAAQRSTELRERAMAPDLAGDPPVQQSVLMMSAARDAIAEEFRALAEELHYW